MSVSLPAYGWLLLNVDEVVHGDQASAFRNALGLRSRPTVTLSAKPLPSCPMAYRPVRPGSSGARRTTKRLSSFGATREGERFVSWLIGL